MEVEVFKEAKHGAAVERLIRQLSDGEVSFANWSVSGVVKYPFVFIHEGKVIGFGNIIVENKPAYGGSRCGHVEDIVIDEPYRGRGFGKALMAALVAHARTLHCRKVILSCGEHNVGFYEKCGFERHEVTMRLDL